MRGPTLTFDLVVATVGRTTELSRFLAALEAQSYRAFRVIVVDQNRDERLVPIVARHGRDIDLAHVPSEPGLSRSRNLGLRSSAADVVAFPDDDCRYPPGLLDKVADV